MTLMLRIGRWMLTERGLFRLREMANHNGKCRWQQWVKIESKGTK